MKFIDFDKDKCDECFKCLRTCPTKAISFKKHQREIINDMCVKCGVCQQVCPQKALSIHSDIEKVKHMINTTSKVAVSLAPSFPSAFKTDKPLKIVKALKLLGFDIIEETGIGAEEVSKAYIEALKNWSQPNAITTCCPAANYFIEMYYPKEIDSMLSVVSPMIAHGRIIKERYGNETKVVFIGPCLAKKAEGKEITGSIDGVLTFHDLSMWLENSSIDFESLTELNFDQPTNIHGKKYPMGAIASCGKNTRFNYIKVQGINQCRDMMEDLSKNKFDNLLIELNVCDGSCINGPDYPKNISYFEKLSRMNNYISKFSQNQISSNSCMKSKIDFKRSFKNKKLLKEKPGIEDLKEILKKIDKYDETDYLNCGACGYSSCLDKAEASYNSFSDITMCMPYLRSKAESLQSIIFDNTPNLIMILDSDLNIIDYNPAFRKIFNFNNQSIKKYNISDYIKHDIFKKIFESKSNIMGLKERFKEIDKVFIINLIYLESNDVVVSIMTDITSNEKNKEELSIVKGRTLKVCQEVINKQMRAAQEIASLLGETTAETKVNLNKLKDIVLEEDNNSYEI
jgi:iron only hydrogenase large subunit-like protein/uncharacterized Fe-S cluster-containing protein